MDVSALRFFTVYGPAGRPDMAPYKFTNWILNEEPIRLFGDGSKTRDFTYITDVSSGITKAIELNSHGFETYNIGGGDNVSISDLIEKISAACRKKAIVHYEKMPLGIWPIRLQIRARQEKNFNGSPKRASTTEFSKWCVGIWTFCQSSVSETG